MDNQAALLNDADTPAFGPENARVAVIEFFDYQCIHCSSVAPELEKVMKTHPDVRYVFKEWPIVDVLYVKAFICGRLTRNLLVNI